MASSTPDARALAGPTAPVIAWSFFLAGLGTVMLGPLLPRLLAEWSLTDQRGGLLLLAKFSGAFLGGVSVPQRLARGIFAGHLLAAAGFVAFACSPGLGLALPALLLAGFGLGQIIAGTNILAGRRWSAHPGSALALINLFWSLGAVSTGVLVAVLLPRVGWRIPVLWLAVLLLLTGCAGLVFRSREPGSGSVDSVPAAQVPLTLNLILLFGALLLLYGGLETCLTSWLTTFTLRVTGGTLLGGQSGFVLLWLALTAGRGLASALLRRWPDTVVQRWSLLLCLLLVVALSRAHTPAAISLWSILLGVALAPVFPSTYGLVLRRGPSARIAGLILAVSGLGAALFPWLMGLVSTHSGSLRLAMAIPVLLVLAMLFLSFSPGVRRAPAVH